MSMRPESLDIVGWRACTPKEMVAFCGEDDQRRPLRRRKGSLLFVRSKLRPVDVYAYLRARFGQPNGMQNLFRRDDSDNLIHWDFNLKAGDADIYIAGASREIQFMSSEQLTDEDWRDLIVGLKADFGRVARDKKAMTDSFEKFVVFPNKYVATANVCAELHAEIVDAPARQAKIPTHRSREELEAVSQAMKRSSARATVLYGACITLSLLTPVLAEAFINMFILTLCRSELKRDAKAFADVVRARIPERLAALHVNCVGMTGKVDKTTREYRAFLRVVNKRNRAIHGDVDPLRDQIETVYFEGKRPLFAEGGHHIGKFHDNLERLHQPGKVVEDYENVHAFLHQLTTYLEPPIAAFFDQVINDAFPGYETRKMAVTKILPATIVMSILEGARYDDELAVGWG